MFSVHSTNRLLNRSIIQTKTRRVLPARCPAPLTVAIAAFRRAIRAHRKPMKLAPSLFDYGIVDYEEKCRKADAEWAAQWEPAFLAAYGPESAAPANAKRCSSGAETVSTSVDLTNRALPKSPAKRREMEKVRTEWQSSMQIGREAMELHEQTSANQLMSFGQMVSLLEIAFDFGRLSTGLETNLQPGLPDPSDHSQFLADLERAYGNKL